MIVEKRGGSALIHVLPWQIVHIHRDVLLPGERSNHKIHDAVHFLIRRMTVDNHDFPPP